MVKPEPIILLKLSVMLLSNAPKLCSNYAHYAPNMLIQNCVLTALLEYLMYL